MRYTIENKWFSIDFVEDYSQFFNIKRYNWLEYTFFHCYVEADRIHGGFEAEFGLLGLGVRVYWVYNNSALTKVMKKYDKILKSKKRVEL